MTVHNQIISCMRWAFDMVSIDVCCTNGKDRSQKDILILTNFHLKLKIPFIYYIVKVDRTLNLRDPFQRKLEN